MPLKAAVKTAVLDLCRLGGINAFCRHRHQDDLLILCYHSVVKEHRRDRFGYGNSVSEAEFDQHLEFLAKHFQPVSGSDVATAVRTRHRLPKRSALITFDDGYRNNLTLAAPLLRARKIPAIIFITTGYIGTSRMLWPDEMISRILDWSEQTLPLPEGGDTSLPFNTETRRQIAVQVRNTSKRLPAKTTEAYLNVLRSRSGALRMDDELHRFMSWDEVRSLRSFGIETGSHTLEHPILTRIPAARLQAELSESKAILEAELGEPCTTVAYPNGGPEDVSAKVLEVAERAGYVAGFTVSETFSPPGENRLALSRICVQGHLAQRDFEWRASGTDLILR